MPDAPEILSTSAVSRSRLFHVEELRLRFSNGVERIFERLNMGHQAAVIVVAMPDPETVLLVREYGAGLGRYHLSLPRGARADGENPLQAANRELMEEAGFHAGEMRHLKQLALSPSYMSGRMDVVLARDLSPQRLPGDEPEPLEVVPWPWARLDELMAREECCEAYALAALQLAQRTLGENSAPWIKMRGLD